MIDFLTDLEWRGLIQDCSDREALIRLSPGDSFYVGYDPSAPSLQIGNLVPITVSLRLARAGLQAIQLFGGATGAIGDPSGKSAERKLLTREVIDDHVRAHRATVERIFGRMGVKAEFVNNYDWSERLNVIEFLRDIGKHFTVNYMIAKEVVKARLEGEGISFTEFSYMLLQANDFYHLWKHKHCRLQAGGSDQWGNITAGLELIRRKEQGEAVAFSIPLLLDSQGRKFGKSEVGALWLSPEKTSPYRFHQYWLNVEDADAIRYLKVFTFHEKELILEMEQRMKAAPEKREAQKLLADSMCTLVHGEEATADAKRSAEVLFGGSLDGFTTQQLEEIFCDVPSSRHPRAEIMGKSIVDVFALTKLSSSKGEARRLITSGGAYVNNSRISDPDYRFEGDWLNNSGLFVLRSGKKSYHLLKLE